VGAAQRVALTVFFAMMVLTLEERAVDAMEVLA